MDDQLSAALERVAQENPAATQQTMQALQQAVAAGELDFPPHLIPRIGELIQVAADNPNAWPQVRQAALQLGASPGMLPAETATADEIQQFVSGVTMLLYLLGKMNREAGGMPQPGMEYEDEGMGMPPQQGMVSGAGMAPPTQQFGDGGMVMNMSPAFAMADGGLVPGQTSLLNSMNTRGAMTEVDSPEQRFPTAGYMGKDGNPMLYNMGDGTFNFAKGRRPEDMGLAVRYGQKVTGYTREEGASPFSPATTPVYGVDRSYQELYLPLGTQGAPGRDYVGYSQTKAYNAPSSFGTNLGGTPLGTYNGYTFTPFSPNFDPVRGFADGGYVDSQPAMLTPGEYVLTPEATQALGVQQLDNINMQASGRMPGPRVGGMKVR